MTTSATVVNYGIGNLRSVCRALEFGGGDVKIATSSAEIRSADRLILPGVGAFSSCMEELRLGGLVDAILDFFISERPFLGICVGMQMMMDSGEEFGLNKGLGLISGPVRAIPASRTDSNRYKVPHIGWTPLKKPRGTDWSDTILADCGENEPVYFLHSYTAEPTDPKARLADADYHGTQISAAIRGGNRYGFQFHPEKSGPAGLSMLQNFLSL
jgi:glutamine amidotransferase